MRTILFGIVALLFVGPAAHARPFTEIYRSPEMMAMGGAGMAMAEGMDALFVNPAGLAATKNPRFQLFHFDVALSQDTVFYFRNALAGFSGFGPETITSLIGQNHFMQAQINTGMFFPYFAVGYLFGGEYGILARNMAFPTFTLINQQSHIIQAGSGFSLGKKRGKKDPTVELRLGGAVKLAIRQGGYRDIPLLDMMNLSLTYLEEVTGAFGTSYGFDLGSQFIVRTDRHWQLRAGLSFINLGDITFASGAQTIEGDLVTGLGVKYVSGKFTFAAEWDAKHILESAEFALKSHAGFMFGFPFVKLYGGFYQAYPTFGIAFDFWLMKILVNSYVVENGSYPFQDPERRWSYGLTMNIPL